MRPLGVRCSPSGLKMSDLALTPDLARLDWSTMNSLGVMPPDPSVQRNVIVHYVSKLSETGRFFDYRLNAYLRARNLHGPIAQPQVDDLWQYLVAEAREVHSSPVKGTAKKAKAGGNAPESVASQLGSDVDGTSACSWYSSHRLCASAAQSGFGQWLADGWARVQLAAVDLAHTMLTSRILGEIEPEARWRARGATWSKRFPRRISAPRAGGLPFRA